MDSQCLLPIFATQCGFCLSAVRRTGFVYSPVSRVARDVSSGLAHMHSEGLVYNDLSTQNVLVFLQEEGQVIGKLSSTTMVTGELACRAAVCCGTAVAVRQYW